VISNLIKITLNIENFEKMKNGTFKVDNFKTIAPTQSIGGIFANTLLELASLSDTKVGKTAKLIKELIRIFST
jgi:hypothetical protein